MPTHNTTKYMSRSFQKLKFSDWFYTCCLRVTVSPSIKKMYQHHPTQWRLQISQTSDARHNLIYKFRESQIVSRSIWTI